MKLRILLIGLSLALLALSAQAKSSRIDYAAYAGDIIVGQLRCRVVAIQPLDLNRLKADRVAGR